MDNATQTFPSLLKTGEAAKIVRLSESQLCKLRVYSGGPQFIKIGRSVFYAREDLEAWAFSNRHTSTAGYSRK